ncbi:phosphatidate cytidylyltransferase [bacterium]|nr:phosphatidate cytidylyltransferase [bacterium]
MSQLRTRIITALLGAPAVLAVLICFGQLGLGLLMLALVFLGTLELRKMLSSSGITFYWLLVLFLGAVLTLLAPYTAFNGQILIISVLAIFCRGLMSRSEHTKALEETVFSIFALLLLPFLSSFAILTRAIVVKGDQHDVGLRLVILLFTVTWLTDSAAYFVGKTWGKYKALPRISPSKTLEGFVGGILAATISCAIFCALFLGELSFGHSLILGLLLGVFGQVGDLFVSLVKRAMRTKDAGSLLPGHGGVLDRMDGFLFNAPVLYVFAKLVLLGPF